MIEYNHTDLYWIQRHHHKHQDVKAFHGKSMVPYITIIDDMINQYHCKSILDYGCGKAQFWPSHWSNCQGYDPAVEKFSQQPSPADCVICCDVMEHIHHESVHKVLSHINELAIKCVFFNISCQPATKQFDTGENCHVTVRPAEWWKKQLTVIDKPYTVRYDD